MAVEYGTVAIVPKGTWDSGTQYEAANLVTHDGSSFLAHTQPPVGTPPTDTAYWQVSAAGTGKATADIPGTVKPDGKTLAIDNEGTLSVVQAAQNSLGVIKGSDDITVEEDGGLTVNTAFTQAAELANLIAGEAVREVLGKISKSIATTMNLDQNALLKNMLTSVDVNDANKIPTSMYVHTLTERIGMDTELTEGSNLTSAVNQLNNNLSVKQRRLSFGADVSELYDDASYHPYAIIVDKFVYVSGNFRMETELNSTSLSNVLISGMISPVKMKWVPLFNMDKGSVYYAYIKPGGTELIINTLPVGNYSISFGYQSSYGPEI